MKSGFDASKLRNYAYNEIQLSSFLDELAARVQMLEMQLALVSERVEIPDPNGHSAQVYELRSA